MSLPNELAGGDQATDVVVSIVRGIAFPGSAEWR